MVTHIFNFNTWVAGRYLCSRSKIHLGFKGSYGTAITTQRNLVLKTKIYKKYKAKYYYNKKEQLPKYQQQKTEISWMYKD